MTQPFVVRPYEPDDYAEVAELYRRSDLYGGVFDPARDAPDRLAAAQRSGAESVLVAEVSDGCVVGTVSLVDDGRLAWLFRFAVDRTEQERDVARALYDAALAALRARGHTQVLVYTPADDARLKQRYADLAMNEGADYTCFWADIAGAASPSR